MIFLLVVRTRVLVFVLVVEVEVLKRFVDVLRVLLVVREVDDVVLVNEEVDRLLLDEVLDGVFVLLLFEVVDIDLVFEIDEEVFDRVELVERVRLDVLLTLVDEEVVAVFAVLVRPSNSAWYITLSH